jgi:hypothetical protein
MNDLEVIFIRNAVSMLARKIVLSTGPFGE